MKKFKPSKKKFVKITPKEPLTNDNLKNAFRHLNRDFFGNRLPDTIKLCYMINCGYEKNRKWRNVDGYFDPNNFAIFVDSHLSYSLHATTVVLLHEMAHADLQLKGYVGYQDDAGHGTVFQGELCRLFNVGAYDGVL